MSKYTKPQNKKSHYARKLQPRKPSRHQKLYEAARISLGLDRSPRSKKRAIARLPLFASHPLTRRSRRHKAAHRRLIFTLRARRKQRTLPRRRVSRRTAATLFFRRKLRPLIPCVSPSHAPHSSLSTGKWGVKAQLLIRKCTRTSRPRKKLRWAAKSVVVRHMRALRYTRKQTCSRLVRSRSLAQRIAIRRVFVAQRRILTSRAQRALRRRRRVRPRKRRRYAGKFGKRRRRLERRDKVQFTRFLARGRSRTALRRRVRHGLTAASTSHRQLHYARITAIAGLLSAATSKATAFRADVAAGSALKQHPRLALLLRAQRARRRAWTTRRNFPLLNRRALRRKRLKERKRFREGIAQARSLDAPSAKSRRRRLLHTRKGGRQLLRGGQANPLPQPHVAYRGAPTPPLRRFF